MFKIFQLKSVPEVKSISNGIMVCDGTYKTGWFSGAGASVCPQLLFECEKFKLFFFAFVLKNCFFLFLFKFVIVVERETDCKF